jgi:hypothetical protein
VATPRQGQLDQVSIQADHVSGVQVHARVGQLVGHVGQLAGTILQQNGSQLAFLEADVAGLQCGAGGVHIVRDDPQHALIAKGHARHRFDVDPRPAQNVGDPTKLTRLVAQVNHEVSHGDLLPLARPHRRGYLLVIASQVRIEGPLPKQIDTQHRELIFSL